MDHSVAKPTTDDPPDHDVDRILDLPENQRCELPHQPTLGKEGLPFGADALQKSPLMNWGIELWALLSRISINSW